MLLPTNLKPFIDKRNWKKLALHELEPSDRALVLDILRAGLKGADPRKVDSKDLAAVIALVQELADDFREEFDDTGFGKRELMAAVQASRTVVRELKGRKRRRA